MSWARLRDAYSTLSAGRQRGLRARWMDAIEVSPEKVIVNAKREAAVGAGGVWREHRPLRRGECYPPNGQCVVYVLFDADHHPISIHSTNRFSQRLADHRSQGKRWVELGRPSRRQRRGARDPGPDREPVRPT
jgi:hypothetical protein